MRALSVLAVVWAHAKLPGLPGGFTGVDVFFVISGFLITRLLLTEMSRAGRIDLLAFWARRARRLLPNAFAALIGTALLALFLFPGYDPTTLAWEITFAALEVVNFHFLDKAVDYFQSEGLPSPVLHFWSLSVEEQFYVVWPLLLVGVGVCFRQTFLRMAALLLALIWVISFAASVSVTYIEQPIAYFSTGTRFWQLATGALLAANWEALERLPRNIRAGLAWCGLVTILTGFAILGDDVLYPGAWALLPTLGAAGLLLGFGAAAREGALRRALASPAMQWIGARSYSWYLWHWPLFVLPRMTYPDAPYVELIAVPISLAVACAAYSWVEIPLRKGRVLPSASLPTLGYAAMGIAVVCGLAFSHHPLLPFVQPELARRHAALEQAGQDRGQPKGPCKLARGETVQPDCLFGDRTAPRRAVLFGDSHAGHWFSPIDIAAKQSGWQLRNWTKSSCPSAEVKIFLRGLPYSACDEWRENVLQKLTGSDRPDLVILSNYMGGVERTARSIDKAEQWRRGLRKTISRLLDAQVAVLLIRDVPRASEDYRSCFLTGDVCERPRADAFEAPAIDAEIAREFGDRVVLADFSDVFCGPTTCPVEQNGLIIYRDEHHLTASYAATFAPQIAVMLEGFARKYAPAPGSAEHGKMRGPALTSSIGTPP